MRTLAIMLLMLAAIRGAVPDVPSEATAPPMAVGSTPVGRWAEPAERPGSSSTPSHTPAIPTPEAPAATAEARPGAGFRHSLTGIASWGYGWAGVVTRLPRGTPICVYGPIGHWCGRSEGYGPAKRTGRIADLSKAVFADVVGDPRIGLGKVKLTW